MATPTIARNRPPGANTVGTVATIAGLTCQEYGGNDSPVRQTVFKFDGVEITIPDSTAYVGTKIYDFPTGYVTVLAAVFTGTLTTTSAIASTLNSGVTVTMGVGTAAASNTTLSTTMMDVIPGSGETPAGFTSSSTIDVASAEITMKLDASTAAAWNGAQLDGTGTAKDLYFNLAVPTATDIDADATVEVDGSLVVTWILTMTE